MKLALTSDLHGVWLPDIPAEAEGVIIAGDLCPDIYKGGRHQVAWLREVFAPWAEALDKPVWLTWGNHCFCGERVPEACLDAVPANVDIVVDQTRIIGGKKVWFSPWSPLFGGWAFMRTEDGLADRFALIPEDTEILVSHSPPYGYGDLIAGSWFPDGQPAHVGSTALRYAIERLPNLEHVICGHIHEGRGTYQMERDAAHGQVIVGPLVHNVSCVDATYEPVPNGPVVLEI